MRRKQRDPRSTSPLDLVIGKTIRERRHELGMSQTELGDALGVTFQQIQKIERGINRISAVRLYHAAKALDVPIVKFFEG